MKIVRQDEHTLILRPAGTMIFGLLGLVFVVVGLFASFKALLIGAALIIPGVVLVISELMARSAVLTFDRLCGNFIHRRGTFLGVKTSEYKLCDITEVLVAASRDGDGAPIYRLELTHAGTPIPLTKWGAGKSADKEQAAAAIREFLQLQ